MFPIIAVSGCNGQLGSDIVKLSTQFSNKFTFLFADRQVLDLANFESIETFFINHKPNFFINAAAYTAVDKAETEQELAFKINAYAVEAIAQQCKKYNCTLIHISTDYVFDGIKNSPYNPQDATNPLNVYGASKLLGEQLAFRSNENTFIIRTSWVYNETGKNFVNTMLRLMKERESISVVNDQIGSPTYAPDLAEAIFKMIEAISQSSYKIFEYKIYHFSNEGIISWYDFAVEIKKQINSNCKVIGIPSSEYPTPAQRSNYGVMDTSQMNKDYGIVMTNWRDSLKKCLSK